MSQHLLPRGFRNAEALQKRLHAEPEERWIRRGELMALRLFHQMAERVPAYMDFLKQYRVDAKQIKTINDFQRVPTIDKDNYLRKYPRKALCWDGVFADRQWVVSTTSGSTGKPFYFPRTDLQDEQYAITAELYLRENFSIQDKTTLYVDAFAMGAWIGGLFTYEAIKRVADKGYKITIITPGIHKQEVINSIVNLGEDFDQVIIGCYPPMMKDILDLGIDQGVDWAKYNLGLVLSAEGFGEVFRDHVYSAAGIKDVYRGSLNHYGTVDQGTLAHETPTSILIRRYTQDNKTLFHKLFGAERRQPTLAQYIPELFCFESVQNRLLCSSYSGIPLVRYDLKDRGGILTNKDVEREFENQGLDFRALLEREETKNNRWNLPFVYLTERDDFSVKLAGGMIYPEEIRKALLNKEIVSHVTGKFTMEVVLNKKMQPKFVIHVETTNKPVDSKKLSQKIQKKVVDILLAENSEYVSNYRYYGKKIWPKVVFWPYEHPLHFSGKGKQKWVKKQ